VAPKDRERHKASAARAAERLEAAQEALFESADALADFMEEGGELITDWTPGQVRMCREFIALRSAVDQIQAAAHQASVHRMITDYYVSEEEP
jgi:hypothetical protein